MTRNILNAKITSSVSEIHSTCKSIESPEVLVWGVFLSFKAVSKIHICKVQKRSMNDTRILCKSSDLHNHRENPKTRGCQIIPYPTMIFYVSCVGD